MMEVMVTTGVISRKKLQTITPLTNRHPTFYRPGALPVTQALKGIYTYTCPCLRANIRGPSGQLVPECQAVLDFTAAKR